MPQLSVPLTGRQYQIEAGPYTAKVTGLGAGLRELEYHGKPLIHGYDPDELPPAGAGQLLAPWPNRIDAGTYTFDGAEHQLALSEPARATAIHGLTRWANWTVVEQDAAAITLRSAPHGQQGYPFSVEIDAGYRVDPETGLHVTITARNRGSHPAPYGNGWHPYLTVRTSSVDECELTLPAAQWLPLDDRGIPSGPPEAVDGTRYDFRKPRLIGDTSLDTAFTSLSRADGEGGSAGGEGGSAGGEGGSADGEGGSADGEGGSADGGERSSADGNAGGGPAWAHLAANGTQVSLWAGPGYGWLQVFTGDPLGEDRRRKAIAIEPMTCPPNAFVTGHDLLVLQPGDELTHTWGILATT